jgi:hypothetical protein
LWKKVEGHLECGGCRTWKLRSQCNRDWDEDCASKEVNEAMVAAVGPVKQGLETGEVPICRDIGCTNTDPLPAVHCIQESDPQREGEDIEGQ